MLYFDCAPTSKFFLTCSKSFVNEFALDCIVHVLNVFCKPLLVTKSCNAYRVQQRVWVRSLLEKGGRGGQSEIENQLVKA
jgi:hypothetical protein